MQILNSAVYSAVTGQAPPTKAVDAQTYEMYGLPFYKLYEEPSGIFGGFNLVKSIAQINGKMEELSATSWKISRDYIIPMFNLAIRRSSRLRLDHSSHMTNKESVQRRRIYMWYMH